MKKLLTGILTLAYMTVSSGIAMEIHFCMGERAGVEFYGSEKDKCGRCGMKDNKTECCHDEHKFVKIEDSHKNVYNDISFASSENIAEVEYPLYNWQIAGEQITASAYNNSPPGNTGRSVCIMHCVFRI